MLCGAVYVGLVCLSRMYLGKHYLTDLLAGIIVSAVFCTLGILFMNYVRKKKEFYKGENKNGYQRYWDDEAKAPYLFNGENFISYDDKELKSLYLH